MRHVRFVGLDVHAETIAVAVAEPGVLEALLLDPAELLARPGRSTCGRPASLAQQELAQSVAGSQLIARRARTRSRSASCAASGTHTAVRSPAR